jgi:L-alanine-DL-glutamate epimerase-like enolase superfamily enzyme
VKIDAVDLTLFDWPDIPPVRYTAGARTAAGHSNLGLLTVRTDSGLDGHAFLGGSLTPAENDAASLIRVLKPVLTGQDPLGRESLHAAMLARQHLVSLRAIGACDLALWDIGAKAAGLPLYRFLGAGRSAIAAYASSQILDSPAAYADEAKKYQAASWHGYKLHPPQDPLVDIACCRAVRERVGADFPLMLDSAWGYRYPEALRVGRAIEDLDFLWYEDPLSEADIYAYGRLREKLDIPILATEYPHHDLGGYAIWITERATDYLRGDIAAKGGLTTMVKAAHLAEAFQLNYEVHHGGNSFNNMAQAHFCCSIPNTTFFEVLLPEGAQKYGLINDLEIGSDGMVHCPDAPGVGADIDLELVKRRRLATLS